MVIPKSPADLRLSYAVVHWHTLRMVQLQVEWWAWWSASSINIIYIFQKYNVQYMFPSIDTSMPKQQIKMHAMLDSRSDPPTQRHAWSKTCLMLPLFMLHVRYICLHSVKKDLFSDGNMGKHPIHRPSYRCFAWKGFEDITPSTHHCKTLASCGSILKMSDILSNLKL